MTQESLNRSCSYQNTAPSMANLRSPKKHHSARTASRPTPRKAARTASSMSPSTRSLNTKSTSRRLRVLLRPAPKQSSTIDARYFFGAPVVGAEVKYYIYRSRYYAPFFGELKKRHEDEQDAERIHVIQTTTTIMIPEATESSTLPVTSQSSSMFPHDHANEVYRFSVSSGSTNH